MRLVLDRRAGEPERLPVVDLRDGPRPLGPDGRRRARRFRAAARSSSAGRAASGNGGVPAKRGVGGGSWRGDVMRRRPPARTAAGARCRARSREARRGRRRRGPSVRAWTRMLPMAVASTGPATTRRPVASAVSWHSRAFCEPPPTTWMTSIGRPARRAASSIVRAYSAARLSRMQRTRPGAILRDGPARRLAATPRSGPACRPAGGTTASCGSNTGRRPAAPAAASMSGGRLGRSRPLPRAQRLLEQPQPGHVAQEPDRPVDAALVGEVRRPGSPR